MNKRLIAIPVLLLAAGAAVALAQQGLTANTADAGTPSPGSVTFAHHPSGWELRARPIPALPGAWELLVRDLALDEVQGTVLDLPVTGAVLEVNGTPLLPFQPLRGGDLYAVLPPGLVSPASGLAVEVLSGSSSAGSVGLVGLLP